jgi:hypothetical protein
VQSPEFETNVIRVGVSSTTTLLAIPGPLFRTAIRNEIVPLAGSVAGPVLVIERSAETTSVVVAVDELFAGTASGVPELTVAVFDTDPVAVESIVYMLLIVTLWPGAIEANEHGYADEHAPLFDTNVSPGPGVSSTVTELAFEGPLFMTVTV